MKLFVFKKEDNRLYDVLESSTIESCVQYAQENYGESKYYWKDTWDYIV